MEEKSGQERQEGRKESREALKEKREPNDKR